MHLEDLLAAGEVRRSDKHLPVEAARTEERGVEVLDPVRGAHDHDLVRVPEPVELDQELVQGLVLLAVEAVAGAGSTDSVELVDEDDRRRVLARGVEELADARRTETREHLHERRGALGVEGRARLVRDRLREQRLTGARRTVEQDALRNACAQRLEPLRLAKEVDDLLQLGLRVFQPGDVVEPDRRLRVRLDELRLHAWHDLQRAPEQVDDHPEEDERQPRQQGCTDVVHDRRLEARHRTWLIGTAVGMP